MDNVFYYNRNGILKLSLNEDPYCCEGGEFKDWSWDYDEQFSRFRNFKRSKKEYPLTISVLDKEKETRDELCKVFDEDILAGSPGSIMINGWKLKCYVVEAERSLWGAALDYQITFKLVSETSTWIRETTKSYSGIINSEISDLGRDYTYADDLLGRGYHETYGGDGHDLMDSDGELLIDSDGEVLCDSVGSSEIPIYAYGYSVLSEYAANINLPTDGNGFRVTFYGPVTNPVIYLNGSPIRVYTSVNTGEKLEVTSNGREKTIYRISPAGTKTDEFIHRDKANSPFISIGKMTELSYGEIKFDFTTIESRSEAAWN